ncbi:MAG: O-methyltransferase [Chitinophagaceae bacterium]
MITAFKYGKGFDLVSNLILHYKLSIVKVYSKLQLTKKYIHYLLTASNGKGHGIHSPFVFEFIKEVLNDKKNYDCYKKIEALREQLKQNETILTIEDFGAGSRADLQQKRKVSQIAKSALKSKKFSQLLFRIVNFYQPKNILELGTSLGITTAYLASGNLNAQVITMEGSHEIANVARKNFEQLHLKNLQLIEGNFDDNLPAIIHQLLTINFAFIDGNHRKEPTLNYFNQLINHSTQSSILIFDDIHWSKEMEEAWQEIQLHNSVSLTIDLFFIGLVFLRKENKVKQHFIIRY